jgi:hypothetical protein
VPPGLTEQVEIPEIPGEMDTIDLGVLYKKTVSQLMIANGKLREIARLVD